MNVNRIVGNESNEFIRVFMDEVIRRNAGQREFHQAVAEVVTSVAPFIFDHREYQRARILERMTEPDRLVTDEDKSCRDQRHEEAADREDDSETERSETYGL